MRYFLGVDVGATKTHALIADETGNVIGFGQAGPGNHEVVGYPGLQRAVQDCVNQALQGSGLTVWQVEGAGFGVGGYDWPVELSDTLEALSVLHLDCPVEVVNDAVIGLVAGAAEGWGLVLVAGTGNNVRGRDRQGRQGRVTGNGIACGEFGGGSDMVFCAIQLVCQAWTLRGQPTALTDAFIALTGAVDASDLIEGLVLERYHPEADWARTIFKVAAEGDPVAQEVIAWNARELGATAVGVIRQLDLQTETFDVVLAGSIFEGGALYLEPLRQVILQAAPGARLVRLDAPPVVGGVLLGMEKAGLDGYPLRERLIASARDWLDRSE